MTFISSSFNSLEQNNKIGRKYLYKNKKQKNQTSGTLQNPKIIQTEEEKATSRAKAQQEMRKEKQKNWLKTFLIILLFTPLFWILIKSIEAFLVSIKLPVF